MTFRDFFSYFSPSTEVSTPAKRQPRRPTKRDWTDNLVCNYDLTCGLYHNSYPGMKLAGGLAYAPIAVPVTFMGLPIPTVIDDDKTQEILNNITLDFAMDIKQAHIESHRDGTCWIWPKYDAKNQVLIWEFIPDETITDIVRDLNTGEIIQIITDEEIHITTGYNKNAFVRRKRTFEKRTVTIEWIVGKSSVPEILLDKTFMNPAGILPINFSNNSEGDKIRGHSDYERLITDFKDYHDIELKQSTILAKFNPKLVQGTPNVDDWKKSNSIEDLSTLDIESLDLLFYKHPSETKPEYIFPERAHEAYEQALKRKFKKIVEESMIPEIAWGVKVEGNLASADKQIEGLVKFVEDKRAQHNESWQKLFSSALQLMNIALMRNENNKINIEWNKLDAISEETKSIIFKNFAQGVNALIAVAGFTKKQLFNLWHGMYPQATDEDLEEFKKELSFMAAHNQYRNAQYSDVMDLSGQENDNELPDEFGDLPEEE